MWCYLQNKTRFIKMCPRVCVCIWWWGREGFRWSLWYYDLTLEQHLRQGVPGDGRHRCYSHATRLLHLPLACSRFSSIDASQHSLPFFSRDLELWLWPSLSPCHRWSCNSSLCLSFPICKMVMRITTLLHMMLYLKCSTRCLGKCPVMLTHHSNFFTFLGQTLGDT